MSELYQHIVEWTLWSLIAFSVITWTLIIIKGFQHILLSGQNRRFIKTFWSAAVGFQTLRGAENSTASDLEHSWDRQDLLERHLRQQIQKERRSLENGLAILASIGNTAPFVGLFGTVFGIIQALTAITATKSASIEVVAGPIGEALVATGIGIAVAVPSVLAYNFFLRRLKLIAADLDDFATDFVSLVQKAGFRIKAAPVTKATQNSRDNNTVENNKEVFA
jgi:biopolymer transport protein ExbB